MILLERDPKAMLRCNLKKVKITGLETGEVREFPSIYRAQKLQSTVSALSIPRMERYLMEDTTLSTCKRVKKLKSCKRFLPQYKNGN